MIRFTLLTLLAFGLLRTAFALDEISNTVGMKLKPIPAGKFIMGSPKNEPRRRTDETERSVTISQPFYMSATEITQGQWKAVMKTTPWAEKSWVKEGDDYAAAYISWNDAREFCARLSQREGRKYRLPTEAEWEYACRAGSKTAFAFGSDASTITKHAWVGANAFDMDEKYAHRVGRKEANAFGLYDMHGNNWEWCGDWYSQPTAKAQVDPAGPDTGEKRVIRGGSWHGTPALCRSACRFKRDAEMRINDLGFRVVMEIENKP